MSLLLSRLCLGKASLVRRSCLLLLSNGFSSSFPQPPPCCILTAARCEGFEKLKIMKLHGRCLEFLDKKVVMKMVRGVDETVLVTIGSCHGWIAHLKDGLVCLQDDLIKGVVRLEDDLIQGSSDTDLKRISLPPLVTLPHCQTQIVTNVAMSSYSPEDEDCVVALKFLGPQLSFCRPAASTEWVNIRIENPCFYSSTVMFSKKDDMFRIPGSGGHVIGSWDLGEHKHTPKLQRLQFRNLPHLTENKRELLHSCLRAEHLVDSRSTSETFLVKWYRKTTNDVINSFPQLITEAIMVFKLHETNAVYTEDIGDLCIFLTKSEPFCVPASSFPGLLPNYVIIYDFDKMAYVELADSSIIRTFTPPFHILPQNIANYLASKQQRHKGRNKRWTVRTDPVPYIRGLILKIYIF